MENFSYNKTESLADKFKQLPEGGSRTEAEPVVFEELEQTLQESGFTLGDTSEVLKVLYDDTALCRSESFTRVMELLETGETLVLKNDDNHANMCVMAGGEGFKTAMQEGFSGKDVGGLLKVVMSFKAGALTKRSGIAADNELWQTKPKTAQVSLAGEAEIDREDIQMISFRFPVKYYPEKLLTPDEQERLEEQGITFIVRHYISEANKNTTQ